jgi:hypothetical protein
MDFPIPTFGLGAEMHVPVAMTMLDVHKRWKPAFGRKYCCADIILNQFTDFSIIHQRIVFLPNRIFLSELDGGKRILGSI